MEHTCMNLQLLDSLKWRLENGIDDILSVSIFDQLLPKPYTKLSCIYLDYILHIPGNLYSYLQFMQKPIVPANFYRGVRDSQLIGVSGYTKEVLILIQS